MLTIERIDIREKQAHWAKGIVEAVRNYLEYYREDKDPRDLENAEEALAFLDWMLGLTAWEVGILLRDPGDPERKKLLEEYKAIMPPPGGFFAKRLQLF